MKAWRVHPGGELRLDDLDREGPLPEGWTEIRVRRFQLSVTEAIALTQIDPLAASHDESPARLYGHEFVGSVAAINGPAWSLEPGSRVVSLGRVPCLECRECLRAAEGRCLDGRLVGIDLPGCFAQVLRVPTHGLVAVREDMNDRAAVALQPVSSSIACFTPAAGHVRGSSVAVLGAGPIGLSLISLARHEGATRVFALARRPETRAAAERAGADVVAGTAEELEALVAREDPDSVAVVFEAAGAFVGAEPFRVPLVELGSRIASHGGRVYSVGNVRGRIDFDPRSFRAKSLSYAFPEFADRSHLEQAVRLVAEGVVPIEASHVLEGLDALPQAIELTLGKSADAVVGAVQIVVEDDLDHRCGDCRVTGS